MNDNNNQPLDNLKPHTTHYACNERIAKYGGATVGCCCTGHECKVEDKARDTLCWTEPVKTQVLDEPVELGDDDRAVQRANARNQITEAHDALQKAGRRVVSAHAEICETLGITPSKESAAAFGDMFVAMEHAYDTIEEQLNSDLAADQRASAEKE